MIPQDKFEFESLRIQITPRDMSSDCRCILLLVLLLLSIMHNYILLYRGYCILAPIPKSNCDFTLTFLHVAFLLLFF